MKMPHAFYTDLHLLRENYGAQEYGREDILPEAMALVRKHGPDSDAMLRDITNALLNGVERSEDKATEEGLFPYDAQIALGNSRRIRRGKMNLNQHRRRKRIIDRNKGNTDRAWLLESEWLMVGEDALEGQPETTVREDVLPAYTTPVPEAAE